MIEVENLCIHQGDFFLRDISFRIDSGSYGVLMGRSGCGKTTIMEAICGLRRIKSGTIRLAGVDVSKLRPGERSIGYVPQDGALFPTKTVRQQIGFSCRIHGLEQPRIHERVEQLADVLGVSALLDRKPHGLSGGEAQRVAIGRAIAMRPAILCLDEPLSSLDEETRSEMVKLLKQLRNEMNVTTLHITHHRSDAAELADVCFQRDKGALSLESSQDASGRNFEPATKSPRT